MQLLALQPQGYLRWFVPREHFVLATPGEALATYTFNKHVIRHRFCPHCGCAPFADGTGPDGKAMAAVNVRCIENVDLAALELCRQMAVVYG